MCLKQVKRREKIALASMLSVVMLMTDLSLTVRLYYINTNGKMCPGNSSSTSGCTTQVGTSFSLSSKYKNQGYKVAKVRSTGQISGSTFVNKKTGKSYVEDLR